MSEDNRQLIRLKNEAAKHQQRVKVVEEKSQVLGLNLWQKMAENKMVKNRAKIQHEDLNEQMDSLERFYNGQMDEVLRATKEMEKMKGELRRRHMADEVKLVEEFETERQKMIEAQAVKKVDLKRRHVAEDIGLEQLFHATLLELMKSTFEASTSSS